DAMSRLAAWSTTSRTGVFTSRSIATSPLNVSASRSGSRARRYARGTTAAGRRNSVDSVTGDLLRGWGPDYHSEESRRTHHQLALNSHARFSLPECRRCGAAGGSRSDGTLSSRLVLARATRSSGDAEVTAPSFAPLGARFGGQGPGGSIRN